MKRRVSSLATVLVRRKLSQIQPLARQRLEHDPRRLLDGEDRLESVAENLLPLGHRSPVGLARLADQQQPVVSVGRIDDEVETGLDALPAEQRPLSLVDIDVGNGLALQLLLDLLAQRLALLGLILLLIRSPPRPFAPSPCHLVRNPAR